MSETTLLTGIEGEEDGTLRVLAPRLGIWTDLPRPGELLGPGSRVGSLLVLNSTFAMRLPEGAAGLVVDGLPPKRAASVEYGQTMFRLDPVRAGDAAGAGGAAAAFGRPGGADLPEGARAVVSPTEGVFYRRPSPEDPPFVEVGGRVRLGDAVGLVEVMKTFNQILYGGAGMPDEAEVLEVRCEDGQEVGVGQVLVVVR